MVKLGDNPETFLKKNPAIKVKVFGPTNKIDNLPDALKFCQDRARIAYSKKTLEEVAIEPYNSFLVEEVLLGAEHHSPFDFFTIGFDISGIPKALAMVLNNQVVYSTLEKSGRYTCFASSLPPLQKEKFEFWNNWFLEHIKKEFPEVDFPKLYVKRGTLQNQAEKLAQENARYMASVFVPTHMNYEANLIGLNKIMHWFDSFYQQNEDSPEPFVSSLALAMKSFIDSPEVSKWDLSSYLPENKRDGLKGVRQKANLPLRFFREPIPEPEQHFGDDLFSTTATNSFACWAQRQRHRTIEHQFLGGYQLGAPLGFFVPPLVVKYEMKERWLSDLGQISQTDVPQAQLVKASYSGSTKNLPMMASERICGNAQLETYLAVLQFFKNYRQYNSDAVKDLELSDCQKGPCPRGGCFYGPRRIGNRNLI